MKHLISSLKRNGISEDYFYHLLTELLIAYLEELNENNSSYDQLDSFLNDIYQYTYRNVFN